MLVFYNILQIFLLPVLLPFLVLFGLFSAKYRNRIPARLGFGLTRKLDGNRLLSPTFWIHALSVGEVTSAYPLLTGLRKSYPDSTIIVSVTTRSGKQVADTLPKKTVNQIIDGPIDFLPVVLHFINRIQPDLYILVETDFWPNSLLLLKNRHTPTMLVNGRVSQRAMAGYRKLAFFFRPMFQSFSVLCMQTARDRNNMIALGIHADKLHTLGNLKFDTLATSLAKHPPIPSLSLPENALFFICGSTHPGEEAPLLDSFCRVKEENPQLFLIIAPRDINRTTDIQNLGKSRGLNVALRTGKDIAGADMLIVDTIGELVDFYAFSDIAYVGGSMIKEGGHNPIEPAAMGIPVLFGTDMEDFSEIAAALIQAGGGIEISSPAELTKQLRQLVESPGLREQCGQAAKNCIAAQRGVIDHHLNLIDRFL